MAFERGAVPDDNVRDAVAVHIPNRGATQDVARQRDRKTGRHRARVQHNVQFVTKGPEDDRLMAGRQTQIRDRGLTVRSLPPGEGDGRIEPGLIASRRKLWHLPERAAGRE